MVLMAIKLDYTQGRTRAKASMQSGVVPAMSTFMVGGGEVLQ